MSLHTIYKQVKIICETNNLPFHFQVDDGDWETAIEFSGGKDYHPPISKNWSNNPIIFCPDLLDYENRLIIEYEEEVGKRLPGAKLARKGHHLEGDLPNRRDSRRNNFYKDAKFQLFQIWESDQNWASKLENWLKISILTYSNY